MHHRFPVVTGDLQVNMEADPTLEGVVQCTCRLDRLVHEMRWLIAVGATCVRLSQSPWIQRVCGNGTAAICN